jgi:hypothetical protein
VGAVALVAYLLTMYPDLAGGDSGELIAAAASGGIVHPPGYPLYTILGRLFAHLPWGTVAWRFNLLSGLCDAAAAVFLFLAVLRWSRSRWAALIASTAFAFSPGVWQYAVCAEVFALNNLFVTLLLWVALLYRDTRDRKYACIGALAFGLGLSNHHTIVFTALPLVLWVLGIGFRDLLRVDPLLRLTGCFAAGLLPYLYLVSAGANQPLVSWGTTETWEGFWRHVLRKEYGTFHLSVAGLGDSTWDEMVRAWFHHLVHQISWVGVVVALAGLIVGIRQEIRKPSGVGFVAVVAPMLAVLVFAALGNLPVADPLHRDIVARFWQQPEVFCCAWLGLGALFVSRFVPWQPFLPAGAVTIALLQLGLHFHEMDRHNNRLVKNYGEELLRVVPQNALLVTKGDLITSPIRYLQFAEGRRPDVRVVDQELIAFPWAVARLKVLHPEIHFPGQNYAPGTADGFGLRQLFDANFNSAPLVVCGGLREGDPTVGLAYALMPLGLCESVHLRSETFALNDWVRESEAALPRIDFEGQAHPDGSWEGVVWGDYWVTRQMRAIALMKQAGDDDSRSSLLEAADGMMDDVVRHDPDAPEDTYRNLVVIRLAKAHHDLPRLLEAAAVLDDQIRRSPYPLSLDTWQTLADGLMNEAGHDESRRPLLQKAATLIEGVIRRSPEPAPRLYRTLAILDGRIGLDTREQKQKAADAWRQYLQAPDPKDPLLPKIQEELINLTQQLAASGPSDASR